jgi:hypothetical protein
MGLMDLQQELLDRQAERDRACREGEAREKRHQELNEKLLALMPLLLKAALGEDRPATHDPTSGAADSTDAESGSGYRDNVISITRARSAQEDRLKAQAFKKIDGMTGEQIAQFLQSRDPHERSMFKRLFDMYCEWKGKKA